jgi:hypothetical protein
MPESKAMARNRLQKKNRAEGIGDAQGRMVREKEPPKTAQCSVCQGVLTVTKTNTELKMHATSKHGNTVEECFPGAEKMAAELIAAAGKKGKNDSATGGTGETKAQKKAKAEAGLDDALSAGLGGGKKKGKK